MTVTARHATRRLVIAAIVVAIVGGWYAFRPELLVISKTVDEKLPTSAPSAGASAPVILAQGTFRGLAHETKGAATMYRLPDGKRVLRLTEFQTSNGPDVRVYLVKAADATDETTVKRAGFVDLGAMKGNKGDQNYDVPGDVDLNAHRAVSIWCARFSVNFGVAPLTVPQG